MNREFHYYVNYIVAIAAGFELHDAYTVAYSAQLVDDNTGKHQIGKKYSDEVYDCIATQSYDLHISEDDVKRIYLAFHFIPGDGSKVASKRCDGRSHPLCTTANSFISRKIMRAALASGDLYCIGIASHAFADTWAHQNFTGTCDVFNRVYFTDASAFHGTVDYEMHAEGLSCIGHIDVVDNPDRVAHQWYDYRLCKPKIHNDHRYISAAHHLYRFYTSFLNIKPRISWEALRSYFLEIWSGRFEKSCSIADWSESMPTFMENIQGIAWSRLVCYAQVARELTGIGILPYDSNLWWSKAVVEDRGRIGIMRYMWKSRRKSEWYHFQEAAKKHLAYVLPFVEARLDQVKEGRVV